MKFPIKPIYLCFIILVSIDLSLSSCVGYHHFREFKPLEAQKVMGKKDLHVLIQERDLYYRLLIMAIPLEMKCLDYSWRQTKLSENRYFLDYTFWNFSDDSIDVSISESILILDDKDSLIVSDYFEPSWITAIPNKNQERYQDVYFVIARNGLQKSFYDVAPVLKTDGVYAGKATEYYSDENGIEIPQGTEIITALATFKVRIGDEITEVKSEIRLKFRDGKRLGLLIA